ncbi:MAG: phage portal protein, partial [Carnobacterium sp.]
MVNVNFLNGSRFSKDSNKVFRMKRETFQDIEFNSEKFIKELKRYVLEHKNNQVPRLKELKRYYLADNNIKYREKTGE